MKRIIVIFITVLGIVFIVAACARPATTPAPALSDGTLPPVQDIVDGLIESQGKIQTLEFDMDMTMDTVGEVEGDLFEMTMVVEMTGRLDSDNKRLSAEITSRVATPGALEMEMALEMYLINDMMYMLMEIPEITEPMWMKMEVPEEALEESWEQMDVYGSMLELFSDAEVEIISTEKVSGIDCYVLKITPDVEKLWQTISQQMAQTAEIPTFAEELIHEMLSNYSVKQWVTKDTYFATKQEIDMTMELTPEAMDLPQGEGSITMDITMVNVFYNHNQPVSIVLPPGAEDAIEMPTQ